MKMTPRPGISRKHSAKVRDPFPDTVTTTIFISNLHCPSCVDSIQESLSSLQPAPEFVSQSIVSHSVVIRHKQSLALDDISGSLEAAGFEIHSIFQDEHSALEPVEVRHPEQRDPEWQDSLEQAVSKWAWSRGRVQTPSRKEPEDMNKRQKHVEQCEQCQQEAGGVSLDVHDRDHLPEKPAPVVTHNEKSSIYDGATSPHTSGTFVVVEPPKVPVLCKATLGITGMTCSSCVSSITHAVEQLPWVRSIDVNLLTASGTVVFEDKSRLDEVVETIEDTGFDVTVDKATELQPSAMKTATAQHRSDRWRATYSVEPITCAGCVGPIVDALKTHSWIEKVDVSLVTKSATVVFLGKEHLQEIKDTIEDTGKDAELVEVVSEDKDEQDHLDRAVSISIEGMFCHHCPGRVTQALSDQYGKDYTFELEDPPLSQKSPVLNIRYIPSAPEFTIRHIFETIKSIDPNFSPSVYHPPTIEERAREMHSRERRQVLFRLVLSISVAIPTFLIGIVFMSLINSENSIRHYIMQPMWAGNVTRATWALFILSTPVYFFAADTFHRRAIKEIKAMWRPGSRTPFLQRFYRFGSMNMLMSLGTSIAYFASIVELALAATNKSAGSMTDSYFDSVVFLTMFLLIGRFLEAYSKAKTGDAVTSLGKLRPEEAILTDSEKGDSRIATDLLEIGDVVKVPHGASPPFDGVILEGTSDFDESSLTGESRPVKKVSGDTVFSGTINKGQPIKIKITTVSGTSMLDQIISAVREGQTRRAPVERVADTITSHFVPFVVFVAIITWVIWLALGSSGAIPSDWKNEASGGWALWSLRFAIAVFVIACPCGIGLAAPTALFVGGGLAAKYGILVKGGGEAFQEASSLDCIVFDKTGTLTQGGDPAVTDYAFANGHNEASILGLVRSLEENSNHPISRALLSFCSDKKAESRSLVDIDEVPGKGLAGVYKINGQEETVIIGNEAFMSDYSVAIPAKEASLLQTWKARGESVALTALLQSSPTEDKQTWQLGAIFAISDPIRPEAPSVISALKKRGIDVWMLSGDNQITANAVGALVGIAPTNIIAGVLPDQKAEKIKYLQKTLTKTHKVNPFKFDLPGKSKNSKRAIIAMVGDGINDAPALSTADLSIAIGSGSDIALSSSSFILINSHLSTLLTLLDLSRVVFRRVYLNFGWALVYNCIAMPIAAGVLYPITTGQQQMTMHHNGVGMNGGMGMGDSGVKHIRLDPVWASLAMALSSVSVVCSSLALRSRVPGLGFRVRKEKAL